MQTHNRRWFLKAVGATAATAAVAGCIGDDDDDDDIGPDDWEGVTEIVVDGYADRWEGVEPEFIEGVENPTLYLTEGTEYTITWVNADGLLHDLQIWDDDDNLVDDYASDETSTEGEEIDMDFTASSEMAQYACTYHWTQGQIGPIEIV